MKHCIIVGTDTNVGKTHVMRSLCLGLRSLGRSVWLHKPVACGYWADGMAEDARDLQPLIADGQDPLTCCRHQWPEAASPHLACAAAGDQLFGYQLIAEASELIEDQTPDHCLIEGAGGICVPLTSDDVTILDLAAALKLPVLLVTRPHLGTLNHTQLSVQAINARNILCLGIVINHHEDVPDSLAKRTVAAELSRLCDLPILAELPFSDQDNGDNMTNINETLANQWLQQLSLLSE